MNETMNTILTRRSTRKFLNRPIPEEELQQIIQAALHAPSGMGRQTWQFTAVKNRGKIQELAAVIRKVLHRDGYDMYQPEVIIIPSNDRESPFGREDDACAMENMFLAAHSLGIGSVWINQFRETSDCEDVRAALNKAGVPAEHKVWVAVALGYPVSKPEDKEKTAAVHWCE